jgi:hypothetical protein
VRRRRGSKDERPHDEGDPTPHPPNDAKSRSKARVRRAAVP